MTDQEIRERVKRRQERKRREEHRHKVINLVLGMFIMTICAVFFMVSKRPAEKGSMEVQAATMRLQVETVSDIVPGSAAVSDKLSPSDSGSQSSEEMLKLMSLQESGPGITVSANEPSADIAPENLPDLNASYSAFIYGRGWMPYYTDNTYCMVFTGGYVTSIKASLENQPPEMTGTIEYKVNLSGSGWLDWSENMAEAGATDTEMPLEAISARLTGDLGKYYDIYYSVLQDAIWTDWVMNGAEAGIAGASKRVDGIRMSVVVKNSGKPGETTYSGGIDPNKPMVALTYDDGPSDNATPRILATLKKYGGRATFFMVGNRVPRHAAYVQQMVEQGSEVANHTFDHKFITKISANAAVAQLTRTNQVVADASGVSPVLMRPCGGAYNSASLSTVGSVGMPAVMWSIDTLDWKTRDAQKTINEVLGKVRDGDIILMHDLYTATADASDTIIPELISRGYQLVTVSELATYRGGMVPGHVYGSFYP